MLRWTLKSMANQRLAFGFSAMAVAGALLLVVLFDAVFVGEAGRIVAYPENMHADVWVMQNGVENMHMASSLIWDSKQTRIERIAGVQRVTPILYLNSIVVIGGRRWFSYIIGIEATNDRAGPWLLEKGVRPHNAGDIVVPAAIGRMVKVKIGDRARLADRALTVVGLSKETFSMANPVMFVTLETLRDAMSLSASHSYLLIDLKPGYDARNIARQINTVIDGVHAMTAEAFIASDRRMALQMGVELIGLMTTIGTGLAILLTAFSVQAFIARKTPELVILKALGTNGFVMAGGVLIQALVLCFAGMLIATGLAIVLVEVSRQFLPHVSLSLQMTLVVRLAALAALGALIAAAFSIVKLARIDPAAAFRV
tara:strand:- start:706 stop:1815 length:1110 start_codon:yes stop_codon:yes gene_type:complete